MTRRERLMATLQGRPVDRPAVSFHEIGGFAVDGDNPDEFNVYNDPSWRPLLQLAEEKTDLIRMCGPGRVSTGDDARGELFGTETYTQGGSRYTRITLRVAGRRMTRLTRRDPEVNTAWTIEHLLKDTDDLKAYLQLPDEPVGEVDAGPVTAEEDKLGEAGIVMLGTGDPLCAAASLFSMADYLVVAMTDGTLFHRLLEKIAAPLYGWTEKVAAALPGRLWRIVGSEYASQPYLPPRLYEEYEVRYTRPMVEAIHQHGGYVRLHSHGRLKAILPAIVGMGVDAIDPIEPPPQGDVQLADVRREYGRDLALFGNLEASDIENMRPDEFEKVVAASLRDGTAGAGRGFVLMPSASPYGRTITPPVMANYETMVRLATNFAGP